ncbi:MAG TPA: carboxypeptidase-like regulatory domain-containing protein, partial [Prolixibacteraceae bacterium]|nr:carboxypeptidase-like regulatory domain-containing protein [Prolixibacteraceae bacterium]
MKTLHYILATFMLLLAICANGQQSINPLEIEVSLASDSLTKAALLDSITKKTNIHFSYNPDLLGGQIKVKINPQNTTILSILETIIDPGILGFHVLNNQIIIYPVKNVEQGKGKIIPVQFITINGSITDEKNEEPIPFCNIAIVGKAIGTMSNSEGNFSIKIPVKYECDTLRFSCLGFTAYDLPIKMATDSVLNVRLGKTVYHLKTIDVVHYFPPFVLQNFFENLQNNYNNKYAFFTTYYREIIKENAKYTDVSEAVLNVLKAPSDNEFNDDLVKFIKGRKSNDVQPFDDIRFKLKGGPYYITKLDIIKNKESFINPEFIQLYTYEFERKTLIDGRETAVISFTPISNLRDMLYEGLLYFDIETWAISRVEFRYTKQGLKDARQMMIEKEPKGCKAIPEELSYQVQYKLIGRWWYLYSARSTMQIKILDKEKRQRTHFNSIAEMLTTNIELGDLQH